jgi:hypothetical protein
MPRSKSTKLFSEITDFFSSSEKAINKTIELYKVIQTAPKRISNNSNWPTEYKKGDIFLLLLLMPLYSVKNVKKYLTSSLYSYLEASKDTLYRFKNNAKISWRSIAYSVIKRILSRIGEKGTTDSSSPKCLIIDDSDLPKKGKFIEHISRIWSHVNHRSVLGFKGLFLAYWDSKSLIGLDFTLHKEKGRNQKYPFGLKPSEYKKQYKKTRDKESAGQCRIEELLENKIDNAISMIKRAYRNNIVFEYVLMDSWFVCDKIIKQVCSLGSDVIGMSKIGKAKYIYKNKDRTAKQIVDDLRKTNKIRWVKRLKLYVAESLVEYKGVKLRVYFCRNTKRGKWHLLVSTNKTLSITQAYEIYSIRWGIEVFFKESKQHFGLGKSQSRDFDAQIADTTLSMMQFNIFSLAKRFADYETLGELFDKTKDAIIELTVCKRIWGFFLEIIGIIGELFEIEFDDLISKLINANNANDNKLLKMMQSDVLRAA